MSRKYKSSNTKSGYSKITFWFSQKCNGNYIVFVDFLSFTNNICLLHWLIESNTLVWTDLPLTFSYIVGYAEAFRPVQSDSQTNVWYSYFENASYHDSRQGHASTVFGSLFAQIKAAAPILVRRPDSIFTGMQYSDSQILHFHL